MAGDVQEKSFSQVTAKSLFNSNVRRKKFVGKNTVSCNISKVFLFNLDNFYHDLEDAGFLEHIEGIQFSHNKKVVEISFLHERYKNLLLTRGLNTQGEHLRFIPDDVSDSTMLTLFNVPLEMSDEDVLKTLQPYCDIGKHFKTKIKTPSGRVIFNGNRVYQMLRIHKDIPKKLFIGGRLVITLYNGQPKLCRYCDQVGHIAKDCPAGKQQQQSESTDWQSNENKSLGAAKPTKTDELPNVEDKGAAKPSKTVVTKDTKVTIATGADKPEKTEITVDTGAAKPVEKTDVTVDTGAAKPVEKTVEFVVENTGISTQELLNEDLNLSDTDEEMIEEEKNNKRVRSDDEEEENDNLKTKENEEEIIKTKPKKQNTSNVDKINYTNDTVNTNITSSDI